MMYYMLYVKLYKQKVKNGVSVEILKKNFRKRQVLLFCAWTDDRFHSTLEKPLKVVL